MLALGKSSGFWIVHSIPKFPPPFESESYAYPNSGTIYGQSVLCVSISTARQADHVLQQLLIMRPIVYASGQSDAVSVLNWDAVVSGDWSPMGRDTIPIESIDRLRFVSIVKSPLARFELYAEQVAPLLATDLLVQTWRNGIGDPLNSTCDLKFKVNNVDAVRVAFDLGAATIKTFAHASNVSSHSNVMQPLIARLTNRVSDIWRKRWRRPAYDGLTVRSIQWPFHDDHSKWAVGSVSSDPFVCIGDLNRMRSQAKRGGGTVCVRNSALWKLFYRQVEATEPCRRTLTDVAFQEGTTITSVNINTTITS